MDLIQEVMNWQLHWEYKDHRRALQRTWREDLLKGEAMMPAPDIVLITPEIS